jgi:adenylate cyclase
MAQVGNFELEVAPASASRLREVDNMTQSFEKMVKGLRSFKKYVPAELVRELILLNREAKPGGERRCLTVLFSDIADFTAFAENTAPEETAEILSRYLTTTSRVIRAHSGTVDKFIGDAVMAFWGAPRPHAAHAADACRAALEMLRQTETPSRTDSSAHAPFHTRIGINTGEVVVANIGSEERMNYTVVGDHVNTAARLEQLNKIYGTKIIAAEATYEAARECVEARMLDVVRVKGKKKPMAVYELLCLKGEMTPRLATIQELFAAGFALYRKRDFEGALKRFEALLQAVPDDPPTRAFVQRCRALASAPPPADWDGVFSASP